LGSQAKTQHESAGFFVFSAFKIHFDKRKKTKTPENCAAVWVLACDEQIHGETQ
jgi:hypothetical protein